IADPAHGGHRTFEPVDRARSENQRAHSAQASREPDAQARAAQRGAGHGLCAAAQPACHAGRAERNLIGSPAMTVAVQFAATATTDALPKIARAFESLEPLLAPLCERSELLVNHKQRQ